MNDTKWITTAQRRERISYINKLNLTSNAPHEAVTSPQITQIWISQNKEQNILFLAKYIELQIRHHFIHLKANVANVTRCYRIV